MEKYEAAEKTCSTKPNPLSCTWKSVGLQQKNGTINYDNLTKYYAEKHKLPEAIIQSILKFCQSIRFFSAEVTVGKVDRCFGVEKYRYALKHPEANI